MSTDGTSTTSRKTRNTASPQDQENAILNSAATEFVEVGVRRASMDDVAQRAGVSRSTLYRRFPNKETLLIAVATHMYKGGMSVIESAIAGMEPKDAIAEAFATGAQLISKDPLMHRLVVEDSEMKGITSTSVTAMFIDAVGGRVLRALRGVGATRPDEELREAVEIMVRLVISMLETPAAETYKQDPEYVRAFARRHLAPMVW